ncbi:MAG: MBL fold metallo-hydrolase [Bacteroidales bacterium]|nr:MBL fold metallo-hydrolase [Candidatus Colimorpha merdihippi]
MKLKFLGTGTSQGVPVIACPCKVCHSTDPRDRHLRTSALLQADNGMNILFDIGPDFREQMLREHVTHLDAILVTHAHRDHVAGLDDIRAFNWVQHRKMELYCNPEARQAIERDYHYIFAPHEFPGLPEANMHEILGNEPFIAAGCQVIPIKAMHKDLPILGYRIGPLAYITDANRIDPNEMLKLQGVEVLVINALRPAKHFSHFCLSEALDVIDAVQPRRAYLTHMSHEMGLYADASAILPPHVTLSYDGLEVEV